MSKGLSPLIATVLLISMSVLIGIIVMNWMTILTKEQKATISNKTVEAVECIGVVIIEDVYFDFTTNKSRVYVRSLNPAADRILSAKVTNKNGDEAANLTAFPININKGDIKIIEFNITGKISACSNFSQALISTVCTSDKFDSSVSTPKGC